METKVYRAFDKTWVESESPFNHFTENNVLYDYFDFECSMEHELEVLIAHYESEYDALSKVPLKKCMEAFNKCKNKFREICFGTSRYNNMKGVYGLMQMPNRVVKQVDEHSEIDDRYYKKLKKIAEKCFELEAYMSRIVEQIWIGELSKPQSDEIYSYLVHAKIGNWRRDGRSEELDKYVKKLQCLSSSFVNEQKTRLFKEEDYRASGMVGYILKIKPGAIIAGSDNDIFSTEYIDGKCEFHEQYHYSNVKRLYQKGESVVFGNGTRICTPYSLIHSQVNTPNELLLDRELVEYEKAFFTTPLDRYRDECMERAEEIAQDTTTQQVQEMQLVNRLGQIDIEVLLGMYE